MVIETIFALIYQHPCRSVLDQDTATGELLLAAPVCSLFAATQTCSSLRNIEMKKTHFKTALSFCYNPRTILLVRQPSRSQRPLEPSRWKSFRKYLWHNHCYQWPLGNGQTMKTILNYSKTASYVLPKEAFAELTCMKWQDRQWEWITISTMCSPPTFLN